MDKPIRQNHVYEENLTSLRVCRPYVSARIMHKAMCIAGNRLCGYSIRKGAVQDCSTKSPNQPWTGGRWGQPSLNGSSRKKAAAATIVNTTRRQNARNSLLSRHKKGAMKKNRSMDM